MWCRGQSYQGHREMLQAGSFQPFPLYSWRMWCPLYPLLFSHLRNQWILVTTETFDRLWRWSGRQVSTLFQPAYPDIYLIHKSLYIYIHTVCLLFYRPLQWHGFGNYSWAEVGEDCILHRFHADSWSPLPEKYIHISLCSPSNRHIYSPFPSWRLSASVPHRHHIHSRRGRLDQVHVHSRVS